MQRSEDKKAESSRYRRGFYSTLIYFEVFPDTCIENKWKTKGFMPFLYPYFKQVHPALYDGDAENRIESKL